MPVSLTTQSLTTTSLTSLLAGSEMVRMTNFAMDSVVFAYQKLVLDGDSLSAQNFNTGSSTLLEKRVSGYMTHMNAGMFQMFDMPYACQFGISGQKVQAMLAGVSAVTNYITANDVDHAFITILTNDVEDHTRTVTQNIADLESYIDLLEATDVKSIRLIALLPRGDFSDDASIVKLNELREAAAVLVATKTKTRIIDAWDFVVDTDHTEEAPKKRNIGGIDYYWQPKAGMMNDDGVHLGDGATWKLGELGGLDMIATNHYAAPTAYPDVSAVIGGTNPDMSGTGGVASSGASGDFADSTRAERASGSNLTIVGSKEITDVFGLSKPCQKLVISGASGGDEEAYFYIAYSEPNFTATLGQALESDVIVKRTDGKGVLGCYLYNRVTSGSNYVSKDMAILSSTALADSLITGDIESRFMNEPLALPAGLTTRCQQLLRVVLDGAVVGNTITIYIAQARLELVAT